MQNLCHIIRAVPAHPGSGAPARSKAGARGPGFTLKSLISMTSVLVFRSGSQAALPLVEDLQAVGLHVVEVLDGCSTLVQCVMRHAPDLLIGEAAVPDAALLEATRAVADTAPRPVLLFTGDADAGQIGRAVAAGIHCHVVDGYSARRLRPLIQLAQARFGHEQGLRERLDDVSRRFEERKVVERAKGILMQARQVSDDDAFQILRTASMHSNQRLGQVSQHIIQSAHFAEVVNRAGQLRMLSQRLVKLYLLLLAGVQPRQQPALLQDSVQRIDANLALLGKGLSQDSFGEQLARVVATWQALKADVLVKPAEAQVGAVDGLAERLLQDAESLTASLERAGAAAPLKVLNLAGRQRMLSQRFAKCALMQLLGEGAAPPGQGAAMDEARREFEHSLGLLNGLPLSTPDIRDTLDAATQAWQRVLAGAAHIHRPAGRDRLLRLEALATASESLLEGFEQLSAQYERSMQMLMG